MKAIRVHNFGDPEVMHLESIKDLKAGRDEIIIDVKAVGVNPVDTYIRSGNYSKPELPYTPGMDASGIVKTTGVGVESFKIGDRVYTSGTLSGAYAQEVLCSKDQVHALPNHVTFKQGAALGIPYTTAYRALFQKAKIKKGEYVFVHGASGGVGIAALQLAKSQGAVIIGSAGTERGLDLIRSQGADFVVNHNNKNHFSDIVRLTSKRGIDVILEMLSNVNLGNDLEMLALGGRVVVIGCRGTVEINPREAMKKESSIMGVSIMLATATDIDEIQTGLSKGLNDGYLNPVIGTEFALKDAVKAHKQIMRGGAYGKIVLLP